MKHTNLLKDVMRRLVMAAMAALLFCAPILCVLHCQAHERLMILQEQQALMQPAHATQQQHSGDFGAHAHHRPDMLQQTLRAVTELLYAPTSGIQPVDVMLVLALMCMFFLVKPLICPAPPPPRYALPTC